MKPMMRKTVVGATIVAGAFGLGFGGAAIAGAASAPASVASHTATATLGRRRKRGEHVAVGGREYIEHVELVVHFDEPPVPEYVELQFDELKLELNLSAKGVSGRVAAMTRSQVGPLCEEPLLTRRRAPPRTQPDRTLRDRRHLRRHRRA